MSWSCSADACDRDAHSSIDDRLDTPQPYNHITPSRPSLKPTQIRILLLHPGTGREPIYGTLWRGDLADSPRYEALSYRWQDVPAHKDCRKVPHIHIIDDVEQSPFPISKSLIEALFILRQNQTRDRAVWIDQISINQTDDDEKSGQVPNMGRIYSEAKKTLIWLGNPVEQDDIALQIITSFGTFRRQLETLLDEQDTDYSPQMRLGLVHALSLESAEKLKSRRITSYSALPTIGDTETQAILAFYQKSWFTRMWPLQEVVLSKDKEVHCGNKTLDWKDVIFFATWFMHRYAELVADPALTVGIKAVNYTNFYAQTYESGFELLPMLRATRAYTATDSRDKVFALVNMIDFSRPTGTEATEQPTTTGRGVPDALMANYRKDPIVVCVDLAEYLIESKSDLGFLSLQDHVDRAIWLVDEKFTWKLHRQRRLMKATEASNLLSPTWVPCWNRIEMSAPIWLPEANAENFNAIGDGFSGETFAKTMTCKHRGNALRVLEVRGVEIGRLKRRSVVNVDEVEYSSAKSGQGKRDWTWVLHAIEKELRNNSQKQSFAKSSDTQRKEFLTKLAVTLTAGRVRGGSMLDLANPKALKEHIDGFCALTLELTKDPLYASDTPLKQFRDYIQNDHPQLPSNSTQSDYAHALFEACRNRFLFVTDNGMMGLGPCCATPGDRICLLRGCRVPFLLRKDWKIFRRNLKGAYKLVGECYLYGAMNGELATRVASSQDLTVFSLI
ncbi:heterokaryon incompatibility protein-domain-containing protein [Rhexocercosporidium sp. MPI-PUGE-AT-0058]|nr:heterokaryon incompatibility protein-domain-containing protein [Rhexocercosporidium sp. MPI-PUGE-AT-0058]